MEKYDLDSNLDLLDYIEGSANSFFVKKRSNSKIITFGKFSSLKQAKAATCLLIKNNWKISDVALNPLIEYGGEFWIFNIANNKLIFEKNFSSFENAVEYIEINPNCNDYHNDIFSKYRKRKKRVRETDNEYLEVELKDKFIYKKRDKFIIERDLIRSNFKYAEFNSLNEAQIAKKLLINNKWNISNEFELIFHDNHYWIFKFSEGILSLLNNFESYEDALDFIDESKETADQSNNFESEIDLFTTPDTNQKYSKPVNFKPINQNPKSPARNNKNTSVRNNSLKFSFKYDNQNNKNNRVWNPLIKYTHLNYHKFRIYVERTGIKIKKLYASLDFIFYDNSYEVVINGNGIGGDNYDSIKNFSEFPLILYILKIHDWDLDSIKTSSSIYFYDSNYFRILIKANTIIFEAFSSYGLAETLPMTYGKEHYMQKDFYTPLDVSKINGKYCLSKILKGKVVKVHIPQSIEEVKIVNDILVREEWDFKIFDKYEYFYLNGLYWKFKYFDNNELRLIGKYESI